VLKRKYSHWPLPIWHVLQNASLGIKVILYEKRQQGPQCREGVACGIPKPQERSVRMRADIP
jgi:hypothetical protein